MSPSPLNSVDLCKKFSSSNSINSFIKFLQLNDEEIEVMFVVLDTSKTYSSTELVSSVYWKLNEDFFISLSGNVISRLDENNFRIKSKILEESSSMNLVKLFTNVPEDDGPMRNLIESLMRLAQVNLDDDNEGEEIGNVYQVYFQSSVIINGKREYPLYILRSESCDFGPLIDDLKQDSRSTNEKLALVQEFYSKHPGTFDSEIFSNDQVYESLRQLDNAAELELWEMVKRVQIDDHGAIFGLTGLASEQLDEVNFAELKEIFGEMVKERGPARKLEKLVQFHSSLTGSSKTLVNADLLLPLLTCVLIKITTDHHRNIAGEVRFIERFARDSEMGGLNGYIITSTNAAIEVIKTICAEGSNGTRDTTQSTHGSVASTPPEHPPQGAFSSLLSSIASIGQMPKALAITISSSLTRSPRPPTIENDAVLESFRERMMATNSANDLVPKQVTDIKEFLELVSRKDTRSVVVKKNPENVKFKARTSRYLITLVVKDAAKAEKLIKMLPSNVQPTILN